MLRLSTDAFARELNKIEQFKASVGDIVSVNNCDLFKRQISCDMSDTASADVISHLQQKLNHVQFRSEVIGGIGFPAQLVYEQAAASLVVLSQRGLAISRIHISKFTRGFPVSAQSVVLLSNVTIAAIHAYQVGTKRTQGHGLAATNRAIEEQSLTKIQTKLIEFFELPHPCENASDNALVSFLDVEVWFNCKHSLVESAFLLLHANCPILRGRHGLLIRGLVLGCSRYQSLY